MSEAAKPATPARAGGRASMKKELPEHFKAYRHVWVFVEYEHGAIHPVSLELLGEGRKLADKLGVELAGVLLGGDRAALAKAAAEVCEYGADLVYLVADPILQHYRNEPYTQRGDRPGEHLQARDPVARRHGAGPRSRRLGGDDDPDRPHRRLHRTGDRRRTFPRRHPPHLRRFAALHHPHAELSGRRWRPCVRACCRCRRASRAASGASSSARWTCAKKTW